MTGLAALWAAFPRQRVDERTLSVYQSMLSRVPEPILADAIDSIIATREDSWLPTVGEILGECAEQILDLPNEQEAVLSISRVLDHGREGSSVELHPLVRETVEQMGGLSSMRGTDGSVMRGQFVKAYRETRAAQINAKRRALARGE